MENTVTVIELLNNIAEGKEVPDYIIWNGEIFEKDLETDYTRYASDGNPRYFLNEVCLNELNDEVKIPSIKLIKEEKEVIEEPINEPIKTLTNLNCSHINVHDPRELDSGRKEDIILDIQTLQTWINKIIKEVNKEAK